MSHLVLVVNCGSSSIKFGLFDNDAQHPILTAQAEQLNEATPSLTIHQEINGEKTDTVHNLPASSSHRDALQVFIDQTSDHLQHLAGVGHRVVHGGEAFHQSVLLTDAHLDTLAELNDLAPLHNPLNLLGIRLCHEFFPDAPQVAVFDTAFHHSLPESAYLYGVPYNWYEQFHVRRYGFHGTSYRFVAQEAARRLNKPLDQVNFLIAHLGNGGSATAIRHGESVDTSMGLTPLDGMIMGTRSGSIDPGLHQHMQHISHLSLDDISAQLNRASGLKGLSDLSNDMRTLLEAEAAQHEGAQRAVQVYCFRAARELAALNASLSSRDALIFTGGIGEHSDVIRRRILAAWRNEKFRLDDELNARHGDPDTGRISQTGSPLVLVIPTNEESMIAKDTFSLIQSQASHA